MKKQNNSATYVEVTGENTVLVYIALLSICCDISPHISFTLDIDVAVCWQSLTAWQMLQGPCCLWNNTPVSLKLISRKGQRE